MQLWEILAAGFEVFMKLAQLALDYLKVLVWPAVVFTLVLIYKRPLIGVLARLRKATAPGVAVELFADELAGAAEQAAATEDVPAVPNEAAVASGEAPTGPPGGVAGTEPAQGRTHDIDDEPPKSPAGTSSAETTVDSYLVSAMQNLLAEGRIAEGRRFSETLHTRPKWSWYQLSQRQTGLRPVDGAWRRLEREAYSVADLLGLPEEKRTTSDTALELIRRKLLRPEYATILTGLQALRREILHADEPPTVEVAANFVSTAAIIAEQFTKARSRIKPETHLHDPHPATESTGKQDRERASSGEAAT